MVSKEFVFGEGLKWMDLCDPADEDLRLLAEEYKLPAFTVIDCMQPDHLPKFESFREFNFLILRYYSNDPELHFSSVQQLTSKLAIFFSDSWVITVHRAETKFFDQIERKYLSENELVKTRDLVIKIVAATLNSFENPSQRLTEQVDFFESHILAEGLPDNQLRSLYQVKRKAGLLSKILTLTIEPINSLKSHNQFDPEVQDILDHHLKLSTFYMQVLDDVTNLLNLYMSLSTQKTSEVMKVLTIFSVFFMPLTFIAGIYGMNFDHMPELRQSWGYPGVLLLMVVVVSAIYFWVRKKNWL